MSAVDSIAPLRNVALYPDWSEISVRYGDLDPNRHVNNIAICQYMEDARVGMRMRQCPDADLSVGFIVAAFRVRFLASVTYPSTVRVGTVLLRVGRTSYTMAHGLFQDGQAAALGRTVTVTCDPNSGKPVPLPEDLAAALRTILASDEAALAAAEII